MALLISGKTPASKIKKAHRMIGEFMDRCWAEDARMKDKGEGYRSTHLIWQTLDSSTGAVHCAIEYQNRRACSFRPDIYLGTV